MSVTKILPRKNVPVKKEYEIYEKNALEAFRIITNSNDVTEEDVTSKDFWSTDIPEQRAWASVIFAQVGVDIFSIANYLDMTSYIVHTETKQHDQIIKERDSQIERFNELIQSLAEMYGAIVVGEQE